MAAKKFMKIGTHMINLNEVISANLHATYKEDMEIQLKNNEVRIDLRNVETSSKILEELTNALNEFE